MLQRLMTNPQAASIPICEAAFPVPFAHTLEYSSPARGSWNIVHTGMLVPEGHQIYICAAGCLRGVILTAAEMGLMGRFSTLELREQDLVGTDSEAQIIEGVTDILQRLPYKPKAVLVFSVCTHHFLGCNLNYVYDELGRRFPDIGFARCYMDPIRQTHAPAPDETLRQAIYGLLEKTDAQKQRVLQVVGNNLATSPAADFMALAAKHGFKVKELPRCASYEEMQELAQAACNVFISPLGRRAAEDLAKRLGQPCMYLPAVWREEEIEEALGSLEKMLEECGAGLESASGSPAGDPYGGVEAICRVEQGGSPAGDPYEGVEAVCQAGRPATADGSPAGDPYESGHGNGRGNPATAIPSLASQAAAALHQVCHLLDGAPVALDYSLVTRPLSLARRLVEAGFNLTRLYADGFLPEEEKDFRWLQENCPRLEVFPTKHAVMRLARRGTQEKLLALGQKAAYFTQSPYFVNFVDNGGLWGHSGLLELAQLMQEAWLEPKDVRREVSRKGWGGPCCL